MTTIGRAMAKSYADQRRHRRRVGNTPEGRMEHNKREQRRRRTERRHERQTAEYRKALGL